MRKLMGAIVCASILSFAPQAPLQGAAAADNAPKAATIAKPSEKAVEYATRYLVAIRIDESIKLIMDVLGPSLVEGEAAKRPELTASDKKLILDSVTESMIAVMPRFTELYAVRLASLFTEEELRQLAEFYESPVGRAYVSRMKLISKASERSMMELVPEITKEIEERICRRIDCTPPSSDSQAPSTPTSGASCATQRPPPWPWRCATAGR